MEDAIIYGFLITCVIAYFAVAFWAVFQARDTTPVRIARFMTLPAAVLIFLFTAVYSIPFFLLFPEQHAIAWEFECNDEQREAMWKYRQECRRRGWLLRILERLGAIPYTRPPWPKELAQYAEPDDVAGGSTSVNQW